MRAWGTNKSPQEIRQLGVVLVAATPGLALTAFVAAMTLPLYSTVRPGIAAVGVLAVFGAAGTGLVMTTVTEALTKTMPLRVGVVVSVAASTTSLHTLYTEYPEVRGLLTSLSSVAFTAAVLASAAMALLAAVQVEQSVKSWGVGSPDLPF
ncbi:hypothetical protein ABZ345_32050 [Lentzea sp. NPDC005914]|uniref:hypothetical protein n=1 Tax=Lentzea sp. NPDC005914 TaxID=3154572 RepID=UPI00340666EF